MRECRVHVGPFRVRFRCALWGTADRQTDQAASLNLSRHLDDRPTRRIGRRCPFEIVKLLTAEIENCRTVHCADMDALTVEYVAAHDRPPYVRVPTTNAALIGRRSLEKSNSRV